MTESKYWSLKPNYSKLAITSNDNNKELVKFITLECQTKIINILIFFDSSNSPYKLIIFIFSIYNYLLNI